MNLLHKFIYNSSNFIRMNFLFEKCINSYENMILLCRTEVEEEKAYLEVYQLFYRFGYWGTKVEVF